MKSAVRVEWLKFRRSRVVQVATFLMGLLIPAMGLGFYSVATTGGVGAVAEKAAVFLVGEGWVGYLGLVDQIAAVALFLGSGIVVAWTFGREHVDRIFPSLFALPVSRGAIAQAKVVVLASWTLILAIGLGLVTYMLGLVAGVGPIESGKFGPEMIRLLLVCLGAGTLALPMGFVASWGRGYLPPIGVMAVIVALAQVAVLFGTGGWFPFAVPGLVAVSGVEGAPSLDPAQIALVPLVAALGIWLTVRWWRSAEVVTANGR